MILEFFKNVNVCVITFFTNNKRELHTPYQKAGAVWKDTFTFYDTKKGYKEPFPIDFSFLSTATSILEIETS